MKRLEHKTALITGCNKGIGYSIVEEFLKEGCIVYAGIRNVQEISENLKQLKQDHTERLQIIELDVTQPESCKSALMEMKKEQGKVDILVNNAGLVSYELVPFINFDHFERLLQTNVIGLMRMCQLFSRLMTRQKSGSIINMSSIVSVKGAAGQASYAASKGAVNAFTLSLAKELASNNIRVNALAPGMVATDRLKAVAAEKFSDKVNQIGLGRMAEPNEIAKICLFLASEESSYVTGQIIGADGSLTI